MAGGLGTTEIENCQDWLVLEHHPDRTLVLVGRTGTGKSATGNSILGVHKFESKTKGKYITKKFELQKSTLPNGLKVNVIDTPDLFGASTTTVLTNREIGRCAKGGIDAVLLVFSVRNRLTEEEQSMIGKLKILFGNQILDYIIVVFTNEDALEDGETLDDYLQDCPEFQEILKECDDRKVLFDNRRDAPARKKEKQVQELLNLVEQISKKNNGKSYMADLSLDLRDNRFIIEDKQKHLVDLFSASYLRQAEAMKRLSSKQETSELKELEKSYKKMLKGTEEKVSNQLKESLREVKEEISKAEARRVESEEKFNQNQKQSADEINKKLNKELKKLKEEIKKIKEKIQM